MSEYIRKRMSQMELPGKRRKGTYRRFVNEHSKISFFSNDNDVLKKENRISECH